mmetsp:Transcript_40268/g.127048  ORF Transcript_40268/g.127048 Transcript_40268/m.127048 type:complete len:241 (-) Transcript_40268:140-862(-)
MSSMWLWRRAAGAPRSSASSRPSARSWRWERRMAARLQGRKTRARRSARARRTRRAARTRRTRRARRRRRRRGRAGRNAWGGAQTTTRPSHSSLLPLLCGPPLPPRLALGPPNRAADTARTQNRQRAVRAQAAWPAVAGRATPRSAQHPCTTTTTTATATTERSLCPRRPAACRCTPARHEPCGRRRRRAVFRRGGLSRAAVRGSRTECDRSCARRRALDWERAPGTRPKTGTGASWRRA